MLRSTITYVCLTNFLYDSDHEEKANLQKMKVNAMKTQRFMPMEMNFVLEKNGGPLPSISGSRPIVVVRQAVTVYVALNF